MNKFSATLCVAGAALALSACASNGSGEVDTAPPYAQERTATHGSQPAAAPVKKEPAERVFREYQTK